MNALTPTTPPRTPFTTIRADIGGETVDAVDARELHSWLKSGHKFSDWFKLRSAEALFIEGADYEENTGGTSFASEITEADKDGTSGRGGQNRKDYALTVDAAMHMAALERTDLGREIRQDLIDWKKRAKAMMRDKPATAIAAPSSMLEAIELAAAGWRAEKTRADTEAAARLLADQHVEALTVVVAERDESLNVAGAVFRTFAPLADSMTITEMAKIFGMSRPLVFAELRELQYLYQNKVVPMQDYMDNDKKGKFFEYKYDRDNNRSVFVRPIGVVNIAIVFIKRGTMITETKYVIEDMEDRLYAIDIKKLDDDARSLVEKTKIRLDALKAKAMQPMFPSIAVRS